MTALRAHSDTFRMATLSMRALSVTRTSPTRRRTRRGGWNERRNVYHPAGAGDVDAAADGRRNRACLQARAGVRSVPTVQGCWGCGEGVREAYGWPRAWVDVHSVVAVVRDGRQD